MNEKVWWYAARSSGIVAWLALAAAVVWGVLLAGRLVPARGAARWLTDLHRYLGGTAVCLTGLHLAALAADSYTHFGWMESFVPFASSWRPGAVAWGIAGFYALIAVEASSLLVRHLPRRLWRGLHLTSYGAFWMATLHGATAGTDAHRLWYRAGALVVISVTVVAVLARVLGRRDRREVPTTAAAVSPG